MERKRDVLLLQAAAELGPYDEYPVLVPGIDPQLHVSRNDRDQPFFLICDHDTVLIQMSGTSRVHMRTSPVLWEDLEPGDFFYVPARTPHQIEVREPSVHVRYKAESAELEGVAWFCDKCNGEVHRAEFELTDGRLVQDGYADACEGFNSDTERRICGTCGAAHEPVDLAGIHWRETAATIRANTVDKKAKAAS